MKRACSGLVSYSSSSSDESDVERDIKPRPAAVCESGPSTLDSGSEASLCPPAKKRKLPPLSASLTVPVPVDNPAEHQGRTRSFPHVEGQYAAYVYIPLVLESGDPLGDLVREVVCKVTEEVEGLRRIGEAPFVNKGGKFEEREDDRRDPLIADAPVGGETEGMSTDNNKRRRHDTKLELHISLSRPVLLRAYQRDEFKRTIKGIAESVAPFGASFTTFAELTNDERTRTFLAMEVGAGHVELRHILHLLAPTLRSLRQKEFYTDPRFHASIAWALLDNSKCPLSVPSTSAIAHHLSRPQCSDQILSSAQEHTSLPSSMRAPSCSSPAPHPSSQLSVSTESAPTSPDTFPRIPGLPPTLVPALNNTYGPRLSTPHTGGFMVDKIAVRIGKEIRVWHLKGRGR